ncbi:hypothetical protein [Exiguobacterium sp. s63]|uniref:hypothetical protein n=1 Tax=Exiguobacterium sp. s63 TaxID=2751274 RepID=UPI001BE769F3|nr:hypothetical protein [Exiguobacterium sp. s63]
MSKKYKINLVGWIFFILLTLSKEFYPEQSSIITTGLGGLICMIIGLSLVFYGINDKHKDRKVDS